MKNTTKWDTFILIKNGYGAKRISETLKVSKSTILGHIRDFKDVGWIPHKCKGTYYFTDEGLKVNEFIFVKTFYRLGGRFPEEIKVDENYRFHNLFFSCEILDTPTINPSNSEIKTFSANNQYICKKYEAGFVRFHTKKAVIHVPDFTASNVDVGSMEVIKRLNLVIEEIKADGYKLDSIFKLNSEHIADMFHPLAIMFKTRGREVLVEGIGGHRLTIDFSHGVPELETENKHSCEDDMKKVKLWFKGLLDLEEAEIKAIFNKLKKNE